jgi:hypothetical protein
MSESTTPIFWWPFPFPPPRWWPRPRPKHRPSKPGKPTVRFQLHPHVTSKGHHMANALGTVTPFPATASDQDVDIQILVALNGGTPVVLDAHIPQTAVTFDCNQGDTYSITQIDFNVVGPSVASDPVTGTVPTFLPPPPNTVPGQPGVPTVVFTAQ